VWEKKCANPFKDADKLAEAVVLTADALILPVQQLDLLLHLGSERLQLLLLQVGLKATVILRRCGCGAVIKLKQMRRRLRLGYTRRICVAAGGVK
jgi:hypothetical protein